MKVQRSDSGQDRGQATRGTGRISSGVARVAGVALLAAAGGGACGPLDSGPDAVVTDSAGVSIVESPAEDRVLDVTFAEDFRLGGEETDEESFYEVSRGTVGVDARGRIVVLDAEGFRVVVFDAEGRHVRTLGRKGGGPGELQFPLALLTDPDGSVHVFDIGKSGFVSWGPEGEPIEGPEAPAVFRGGPLFRDGDALIVGSFQVGRQSVVRYEGGDSVVIVERRSAEPKQESITLESCGMSFRGLPPIFDPSLRTAVGGGVTAVAADAEYVVDLFRGGDKHASLRRAIQPVAATAELAGASVGEMTVVVPGGERICDGLEVAEKRGFVDRVPVIANVVVTMEGGVWVQRSGVGRGASRTDVFDADGVYRGTLPEGSPFPIGFMPDGRALLTETDELDVERLVVVRVEGLGG